MQINDVQKVNVKDVKLDPDNPNVMTDEEMQRLANSMDKYGFLFPIVVDQHNTIVDGEHRFRVFKDKGMTQIPCIKMRFNSDAEKRALRQAANKLRGSHNLEKDIKELDFIFKQDKKLLEDMIGVNAKHLDDMKKALHLIEPKFQHPKHSEDVDDVMEKMDIKRVLHIPVSEEVAQKIKQIMNQHQISDYETLMELLIDWVK